MSSADGSVVPRERACVVIAHNVRSLHNVGALFRTADGAGVAKVYMTGYTGDPCDPKAAKVSLGAEKTVPWERRVRAGALISALRKKGYTIVALEQSEKSIPYTAYTPSFPVALIVGNEVRGLSPALLAHADACVDIPMRGAKESLNVSVAFGIVVYRILSTPSFTHARNNSFSDR